MRRLILASMFLAAPAFAQAPAPMPQPDAQPDAQAVVDYYVAKTAQAEAEAAQARGILATMQHQIASLRMVNTDLEKQIAALKPKPADPAPPTPAKPPG